MSVDPGNLIRLVLKRHQIAFKRINVEIETSRIIDQILHRNHEGFWIFAHGDEVAIDTFHNRFTLPPALLR